MVQGKNPSSGLESKHENITFIKTTRATKITGIVLSQNFIMCAMTPL